MGRDTAGPQPLLQLRGVVKSWRGQPVLKGADLDLEAGAVTWLGGVNGAGKTTLLRIASGLLAPEGGTVSMRGLDPWRDRREFQRRSAILPAGNGGLYARLTVADQLEYQAGLALVPRSQRGARYAAVLEQMGIADLADRRVDRLSMGQRQRVRIAVALLHAPELLLLDEPYTSLDEPGLELLQAAMGEVAARGGAVLWLGPSPQLAGLSHDRELWLQDGLVMTGRPA